MRTIEVIPYRGWSRVLRVSNGDAELLATLDVGPRILSYALRGGASPFHIFADQAGGAGEPVWRNRGGHRLWLAPEARPFSYHPDNAPVAWEQTGELAVRLKPPPETATGFRKELDLALDPAGSRVIVTHRIERLGDAPQAVAPWALTVLAPGGIAIVPQPARGVHPRDLLPNRRWVLWPYTDPSDSRWWFGPGFVSLRQRADRPPTKMGFAHDQGWAGYLWESVLFVKRFAYAADAAYPDGGCNLEIFSNERMLELESLGPLVTLGRGGRIEHRETWELHSGISAGDPGDEAALSALARRLRLEP
jgi:hypothetical protein